MFPIPKKSLDECYPDSALGEAVIRKWFANPYRSYEHQRP